MEFELSPDPSLPSLPSVELVESADPVAFVALDPVAKVVPVPVGSGLLEVLPVVPP